MEEAGRVRSAGGLNTGVRGEGPALVMVHGFATNAGVWGPVAERLHGRRLLCPDLPGFGRSPPARAWRPEEIGTDLAALAGVDGAAWAGWSLGGLIAMATALEAPRRVQRLVLLSATPRFVRRAGDWDCGMDASVFDRFRAGVEAEPSRAVARFLALAMQGDERRSEGLRALRAIAGAAPPPDPGSMLAALDALAGFDLRPRLNALSCPVLIVHGANDAVVPVCAAAELARRLPRAGLAVVAGAGHAPQVSHPEVVADVVQRFLAGGEGAARPRRGLRGGD
jgi:pimeloyl-[acyl-carrier protein] methyl ester esterase